MHNLGYELTENLFAGGEMDLKERGGGWLKCIIYTPERFLVKLFHEFCPGKWDFIKCWKDLHVGSYVAPNFDLIRPKNAPSSLDWTYMFTNRKACPSQHAHHKFHEYWKCYISFQKIRFSFGWKSNWHPVDFLAPSNKWQCFYCLVATNICSTIT